MTDNALTLIRSFVPGTLTRVSWTPPENLSIEEYFAAIEKFSLVESCVQWWYGDALQSMEKKYGETWSQVLPDPTIPGFVAIKKRLENYKWVAGQVKNSTRVEFLTWSHHREIANLDEGAQVELLGQAEQYNWSVSDLRSAIRQYKRNVWIEKRDADLHATDINELPTGAYRILYIDPPWQYQEHGATLDASYGGTRWQYPTMSIEGLAGLPVGSLAASDCVLFLWATSPKLQDAFALLDAWGFEYKTSFVWDKIKHNFGYYNSVRHELLLIAGRGTSTPDANTLYDSVISIEREEHSAKPDEFRCMIDELYVEGKRIELFARSQKEGWDSWGNEAA